MSEFKFKIFEHVIVPNQGGTQGVIIGVNKTNNNQPRYNLIFLKIVDADGQTVVIPITGSVSESELVDAQPPKMVTLAEAQKATSDAIQNTVADMGVAMGELENKVKRLEAAAKRKARKPARNRKRR